MSCNINTPTYTEYEMEKYNEYMEYVEQEVNNSDLPLNIKIKMLNRRDLHKSKDGSTWHLQEYGEYIRYRVEFLPFRTWLLQTERDKKINELLNDN